MDGTLHNFISSYFRNIMEGIEYKALVATILTAVADFTGAHEMVIILYMVLVTVDLLLGIFIAVVTNTFCCNKLNRFLRKLSVQLFLVLVFASLFKMIFHTAGIDIAIVNWLLLLFGVCECVSSVEKLVLIGAPVPPVVLVMLGLVRRKLAHKLADVFNDDKLTEEIEKAIGGVSINGQILDASGSCRSDGSDVASHAEPKHRAESIDR